MHRLDRRSLIVCAVLLAFSAWQDRVNAQGIASGGGRPFVIGFTPVIGPNGGVGGIDVDADGLLHRAKLQVTTSNQRHRRKC